MDINVFNVVDAVGGSASLRPAARENIAQVGRAAGGGDAQVEVVHQSRTRHRAAGRIAPDQRDLERRARGDGVLEAGRSAGANAGGIVFKSTVAGSGGGGDVDQAPALVVVGDGHASLLRGVAVAGDIYGGVDQGSFDQGGGGGVAFGGDVVIAHQGGGAGRERAGHGGAAHVHVIAVIRAPAIIRSLGGADGQDVGARGHQVGLDAAIFHRAAAGEGSQLLAGVGGEVVARGVGGVVAAPQLIPGIAGVATGGALVIRGADDDQVLGGAGRADGIGVNVAIRVAVNAVITRGDDDGHILVVVDEIIELAGLGIIIAMRAAAPTVVLDAGAPTVNLGEQVAHIIGDTG